MGVEERAVRAARRDAAGATLFLAAAVYFGSGRLVHFDPALAGYLAAVAIALFSIVRRVSLFWRRPAAAFYGRELVKAVRRPRSLAATARNAGRDLVAQRFIARRGALRGSAHVLLSWGTLAGFAITLPLVFGWIHFEADGGRIYRAIFLSVPVARFSVDGVVGWLFFHALSLAAVAVVLGASYFLAARSRLRSGPFHVAPLLLLLAVAATGLALPIAAKAGATLFRVAGIAHEAAVIVLLVTLPYGKLLHVFIRPLELGAALVRERRERACCAGCGATFAPTVQLAAVESMLAARGFTFAGHQRSCPGCRRRGLAGVHVRLLDAEFQPRPAPALLRRVA